MQKIDKLKQLLDVANADTVSKKELGAFIKVLVKSVTDTKDSSTKSSQKQQRELEAVSKFLEARNADFLAKAEKVTLSKISAAEKVSQVKVQELLSLIEDVKASKPKDGFSPVKGVDYFDGEPGKPGENGSEDTGSEIVTKINLLEIKENLQIDATHIKNLPQSITKAVGSQARNLWQLLDVDKASTILPTNGQVLKYNTATKTWQAGIDVGGVAWGDITGTLADQTDLTAYVTGLPVSTFANDANYLTSIPASYLESGDNVSELVNDAGYLTSYTEADTLQSVTDRGQTSGVSVTTNPIEIQNTNGLIVSPGSDADADLLTVGVTGSPKLAWFQSENLFEMSRGIEIKDDSYIAVEDVGRNHLLGQITVENASAISGAQVISAVKGFVDYIGAGFEDSQNQGLIGVQGHVTLGSTGGVVGQASGVLGLVVLESGNNGKVVGLQTAIYGAGSGTTENVVGAEIAIANFGSNTFTNVYGIKIEDIDAGTTLNYAIKTGAGLVDLGDQLSVTSTSSQIKISFDSLHDATFTVSSSGVLTINPTDRFTVNSNAVGTSGTNFDWDGILLDTGNRYAVLNSSITASAASPHATASLTGINEQIQYNGAGTLQTIYGGFYSARNTGVGTVSNLIGAAFWNRNTSSGTVGDIYGFQVLTPSNTGTVSGSTYGAQINNQGISGVTNSYGINISSQSGSTNNYAIKTGTGIVEFGGVVGIGGAPVASARLQADSTTQGFLPPRMTTTQKNAISSPTAGLEIYDTTLNKKCVYTGSAWETITSV